MKRFILWLTATTTITLVFGTIYVVAHQTLRQNANDPQIQIAEDTARAVDRVGIEKALSATRINFDDGSLAPFIIIYDDNGSAIGSSFKDGVPSIPEGVFSHVTSSHQDRITWQTGRGRFATVIVRSAHGYVLVARDLREVENRESMVALLVGLGWAASLIVLAAGFAATTITRAKRSAHPSK